MNKVFYYVATFSGGCALSYVTLELYSQALVCMSAGVLSVALGHLFRNRFK